MDTLDILVHVREPREDALAVRVALAISRRMPAHLFGLCVAPMGAVALSTPETVSFQVHEADRLFNETTARKTWWSDLLKRESLAGEWLAAQGEPVEAICYAAQWCDLVIAERPTLHAEATTGWGTVSRTVFGAGVPVIVVPQSSRVETIGERVLVAWNHTRESMRAIRGALPLLRRATEVTVLDGLAHKDTLGARHLPTLDLAAYLARHRVNAQFQAFAPKSDHGAAIQSAARKAHADMIVMGAWGHSRITELVLGGATRYLFQHGEMPMFVAH